MKRTVSSSKPLNPLPNINRTPFAGQQRREGGGGLFWNRRAKSKDSQEDAVVGMHTVEFIADESRKEGVEEGRSRGIGRGISRNIAAFSRAGARNPPNSPCLSNNHIHTGHFPREQWSRYLFPAMIKGAVSPAFTRRPAARCSILRCHFWHSQFISSLETVHLEKKKEMDTIYLWKVTSEFVFRWIFKKSRWIFIEKIISLEKKEVDRFFWYILLDLPSKLDKFSWKKFEALRKEKKKREISIF